PAVASALDVARRRLGAGRGLGDVRPAGRERVHDPLVRGLAPAARRARPRPGAARAHPGAHGVSAPPDDPALSARLAYRRPMAGEFELIAMFRERLARAGAARSERLVVGSGDDAAVL